MKKINPKDLKVNPTKVVASHDSGKSASTYVEECPTTTFGLECETATFNDKCHNTNKCPDTNNECNNTATTGDICCAPNTKDMCPVISATCNPQHATDACPGQKTFRGCLATDNGC